MVVVMTALLAAMVVEPAVMAAELTVLETERVA